MIWTREQAKALIDRTLSLGKADETQVTLTGGDRANVRFARNSVTTSGASSGYSLAIQAKFGQRIGTVTASEFSDAALQRAVRNAEEIARLSPENPEAMPFVGAQTYADVKTYFEDAAEATPEWRAGAVKAALDAAKAKSIDAAGYVETSAQIQAVATSKGQFGFGRYTSADYNLTARTPDGAGSGWASKSYNELRLLQPGTLAGAAIDKAARSHNPTAIEPGKYTVVLEPAAMADIVANLAFAADARQADEGRSFFSKKGGGTRGGETVVSEKVTIYSDPANPLAPSIPFDGEGLPLARINWIEKGVLTNLSYSRYWAQKQGKTATPQPGNLVMAGGTSTIDELIAGVARGVLVTRFWYIRSLDPQTLLFTGLTRDGLFLIENGKVTRPVKNMRWNESPIAALNNLDAMTAAERAVSGEGIGGAGFSIVCPAARIREFTFTSGSDAV
jgi:predicted Zn-dependent protease